MEFAAKPRPLYSGYPNTIVDTKLLIVPGGAGRINLHLKVLTCPVCFSVAHPRPAGNKLCPIAKTMPAKLEKSICRICPFKILQGDLISPFQGFFHHRDCVLQMLLPFLKAPPSKAVLRQFCYDESMVDRIHYMLTEPGNMMLEAPAGSGKSSDCIAAALSVGPSHCKVICHTNNVASEIQAKGVYSATTIDSLCLKRLLGEFRGRLAGVGEQDEDGLSAALAQGYTEPPRHARRPPASHPCCLPPSCGCTSPAAHEGSRPSSDGASCDGAHNAPK